MLDPPWRKQLRWKGLNIAPRTYSYFRHLHLHVISADLRSDKMKNKKHYNSFHPKLGFFIHFDEVMSWFEAEPSFYKQVGPASHL